MEPGEQQARDEVSDIDTLVKEASETIKTLQQRRREIIGLAEATPRMTASLLHAMECHQGHGTGASGTCSWDHGNGLIWTLDPRKKWLATAEARVHASGETEEDFLRALRTIASTHQLSRAEADSALPGASRGAAV